MPYWLNREAIPEVEFDIFPNFSKRLKKSIYVDRALDQFKQWLISLMADVRTAIQPVGDQWGFTGDPTSSILSASVLEACNSLLQNIISEPTALFFWAGRKSPEKLVVTRNGQLFLPNLDALSAGQAILLGMFGTILRYGDLSQNGSQLELGRIEGICIIDEIDAHIHVELQHKVLPKLIKLFPKMQFILSSHSPFFVLGMEKEFGSDGLQIIELPSGVPVGAESYAEFGKALEALTATGAFIKKVVAETRGAGKPIVYVEGETDAPYIKRAAVLLERTVLLDQCDIEWIGAKDDGGQGFHTGKDAFKHTQAVLRANPTLARRRILLLHDNDSTATEQDYESFSVRRLPINPGNKKVSAGIENLLTADCIEEKHYQTKETKKPNGDSNISRTLRKTELCAEMCSNGTATQFAAFVGPLDIIEAFITKVLPS